MAWEKTTVGELAPGDRIRLGNDEFEVARIQSPFMGQTSLVCLIEDTPEKWLAHPAGVTMEIDVLRA